MKFGDFYYANETGGWMETFDSEEVNSRVIHLGWKKWRMQIFLGKTK